MAWNPFRRRGPSRSEVEAEVRELEARARHASRPYQAQYLSRAADLRHSIGDTEEALELWGRAIDAYRDVARPDAAAAACRRVIQNVPDVVRARRTLALLSIGHGHVEEAVRQTEEYVQAARRAGRLDLAVKQLQLMARSSESDAYRDRVIALLAELGDERGSMDLAEADGTPEGPDGLRSHDRWAAVLKVAQMDPEEIRRS